MVYRDFLGEHVSQLGLGAMRLPVKEGKNAEIDREQTAQMVAYAFENGINYFDTAWGYHAGNSESVLGEILSHYPRESYCLASKFPGYDLSNMDKVETIFEKQLEKCRVSYFDFYLFHNVCEMNIDGYLDEKNGIYAYLIEQKRRGRIRHLGFSTHGTLETVQRFLDAYGNDMEFCQIQLNWLDWGLQSADQKVALLNQLQMPIIVMEPLRGGSLVRTDLGGSLADRSAVEVAFRYLQAIPGVSVVLSGMSDMKQLQENIEIFSTDAPLPEEQIRELYAVAKKMTEKDTLPCTGCRYCTDHCPMELNIPYLIGLYNEHRYSGGGFLAPMAIQAMEESKRPSACLGCRACEAVCPQKIQISEAMKDFSERLARK